TLERAPTGQTVNWTNPDSGHSGSITPTKTYQNAIIGKLFYFILYLCALEIAPYYFMYYWITKEAAY
ncbi:MAG: DUF4271 domain-containing protein, partial [Flavobacterium sp.]